MKTYKNIFDQVVAFENLMAAHEHARKGKRDRTEVLVFEQRKAEYCIILKKRLVKQTYRVGPYRIFWIRRPVLRMAMALHYPDRVVQWGIYQVVFPIFDKGFISDSYACRKGKGAHAALDQLQYWMRQADRGGPAYTLKLDVSKYFYRIDHEILLKILNRKITDPRMMWLFRVILHSDQTKFGLPEGMGADEVPPECRLEDVGVPIGNLTSQMFANIYLDVLDRFVKHTLHVHWYIRYMDDIIIIGHDKQELARLRDEIGAFLRRELNLALNHKTSIQPLKQGVEFVGMRLWPTHRRLRHATIRGIKLRLSQVLGQYEDGQISAEDVERTIGSYRGVLSHCECMALKHKLNQTYGKFYLIQKGRGEIDNGNQGIFLCEGREEGSEQKLPCLGVSVQGSQRPDLCG